MDILIAIEDIFQAYWNAGHAGPIRKHILKRLADKKLDKLILYAEQDVKNTFEVMNCVMSYCVRFKEQFNIDYDNLNYGALKWYIYHDYMMIISLTLNIKLEYKSPELRVETMDEFMTITEWNIPNTKMKNMWDEVQPIILTVIREIIADMSVTADLL